MTYNKAELKAMLIIADKLNWQNKPVTEVCGTINQMVKNQQALELDTVGECDDFEETLLSLALWSPDKILSTLYVNDYHFLVCFEYTLFLEDMGITDSDYKVMLDYYDSVAFQKNIDDIEYELECEEYEQAMADELAWYNHARQMGWK